MEGILAIRKNYGIGSKIPRNMSYRGLEERYAQMIEVRFLIKKEPGNSTAGQAVKI
jgi:hypothetical protein